MAQKKNETELLRAKLQDCQRASQRRPSFLGFLDESQAALCQEMVKRESASCLLWGGYEDAERRMAGFFPDYMEPDPEEFPIEALTIAYRREDRPGHRDFLGSFMGLGIERDVVGDILIGEDRCVVFVREEMCRFFLDNIRKIGRVGVKVTVGYEEPLPVIREYKPVNGVVASNRLDCLTALLCRTSREKAAGMITVGLTALNHREVLDTDRRIEEGDIISVRGHGKFIVDTLGPLTGKGRLTVKCRKYQ